MIIKKLLQLALLIFILLSCQKEDFSKSGIINDHFFLKSSGQHMPVTVAGNIDSKKMIIILHGGPGGNALAYRNNYVKSVVESEHTVVYWYQRFSGNTQGNNGDLHISAFKDDHKKLIVLLKNAYGNDMKLYFLAHSWGGFLAPYFLIEPQNEAQINGWIQVGGAHDYSLNDSLTHKMLLHYGNNELEGKFTSDWKQIVEWCETNDYKGMKNAAKLNKFANQAENFITDIARPAIFNSEKSIIQSNSISISSGITNSLTVNLNNVAGAAYDKKLAKDLKNIKVPTLLLWGKYDFVCPVGLMYDIIDNMEATKPDYYIFQHSGHAPMYNEPHLFWDKVLDFVKFN